MRSWQRQRATAATMASEPAEGAKQPASLALPKHRSRRFGQQPPELLPSHLPTMSTSAFVECRNAQRRQTSRSSGISVVHAGMLTAQPKLHAALARG